VRLQLGHLLDLDHYLVVGGDGAQLPVKPTQAGELVVQDRKTVGSACRAVASARQSSGPSRALSVPGGARRSSTLRLKIRSSRRAATGRGRPICEPSRDPAGDSRLR
jgi:hypothetical protein